MVAPSNRWQPRIAALAVLVLSTVLLWNGNSRATVSDSRATSAAAPPVPSTLGPWSATTLSVEERATEILETDDVTLLEYRMGAEPPVWFAQVGGFGNRAAFHPPELCYIGSHYEVLDRGQTTVLVNGHERQVMRLVIGQGGKRFEAWYWFTANGRVTPSYYQQQVWLLLDAIRRKPGSGTLVRISTPLENAVSSRRRLLAFVTSLDLHRNKQLAHHEL